MINSTIPLTGMEQAKKGPPKFIERVIEKVEEVLTTPAAKSVSETKKTEALPPQPKKIAAQQPIDPEQAQVQGSLGGRSEYELPKGTTITLPDGHAFETNTKSKLSIDKREVNKR